MRRAHRGADLATAVLGLVVGPVIAVLGFAAEDRGTGWAGVVMAAVAIMVLISVVTGAAGHRE